LHESPFTPPLHEETVPMYGVYTTQDFQKWS